MKIVIRKKHLSSLSSLLVLSLLSPSASAETRETNFSNASAYESHTLLQEPPRAEGIETSIYRSHGGISMGAAELKHVAYKTHISQAFNDYYLALNELEEHYQDKVDDVLDEYEHNLKMASGVTQQTQQAKQSARSILAELKQQHRAEQEALKLKYRIS